MVSYNTSENNYKLEFPIGDLLQHHINNDIPFNKFVLNPGSIYNNFDNLYINSDSSYIQVLIQK